MKKVSTIYRNDNFYITINEEPPEDISVHDIGEPCSGVLKRWGTRKELIKELEEIIKEIKKI